MEIVDLIKWLPQGGAAGAVIVVVYLFLKQQDKVNAATIAASDKANAVAVAVADKANALLSQIANQFTAALAENQKKNDERFDSYTASNERMQATVNTLVRDQIISNTQMTDAIKGLQQAVAELQKKEHA